MARASRLSIPKLRYTANRGIGRHVFYRDRLSRTPRRHRLGLPEPEREREARVLYHAWVLEHLGGDAAPRHPTEAPATNRVTVCSGATVPSRMALR